MRRQQRDDAKRQSPAKRDAVAGGRHQRYQSDALARSADSPYPVFGPYEEYAEGDAPPPTNGSQSNGRATVVVPAVTLPSAPVARAPRAPAAGPKRGQPARGQTDLTPGLKRWPNPQRPHEPDADEFSADAWLTGHHGAASAQATPHTARTRSAQRAAVANPLTSGWSAVPPASSHEESATQRTSLPPRPTNHRHRLSRNERLQVASQIGHVTSQVTSEGSGTQRAAQTAVVVPSPASHSVAEVVLIPAARRLLPAGVRRGFGRALSVVSGLRRRPTLLSVVVLVMVVVGVIADMTGVAQEAGTFSTSAWHALAGLLPSSSAAINLPVTPPTDFADQHYMDKYGFFTPSSVTPIPSWEYANLVQMAAPDIRGTLAYDKRYHQSIEPQLVMYWTHAEGIRGRISYSNCANESANYFSNIANCDHASFWQLGYGNQFSVIYVLKNAFTDIYGDPNNTTLVQKVGQWVLNFDRGQGTTPACGGYSCTFPAKTIDAIMSGINLKTGVVAEDNWWASVLSRDPAINCYMIAHALTFFSHAATRNWVGCYYAAPCWQRNSDRLADVLAAWHNVLNDAGIK
jgi:hypothetical protein